jgi:hypothetical protein
MKRKGLLHRYGLRRRGGRRQIVITAETSDTYIIRQEPKGPVRAWCGGCGEEIECLTVEQAAQLTGVGARQIFRRVEAGEIHYCETDEGHLLICPNSVASFVRHKFLEREK